MVEVTKIVCLSENAFSILANAYNVERILWFERENDSIPHDSIKEEYMKTLFEMKQQNLICADGEFLKAEEYVDELFQILKYAYCIVTIQGRGKDSVDMCLYIDWKDRVAVLRKGNRKKDYVKLEKRRKADIFRLLEEGGHYPDSILKDMTGNEKDVPDEVVKKINKSFSLINLERKKCDVFKEREEAETYITILDAAKLKREKIIVILHYPIKDVIVGFQMGMQKIVPFSKENMQLIITEFLQFPEVDKR